MTRLWLGNGGDDSGVWSAHLDDDGEITGLEQRAELDGVSFLAPHPSAAILYALSEVEQGTVTAFRISDTGELTVLGSPVAVGANPCHLEASPDGRWLYVANYVGGGADAVLLGADGAPDGDIVQMAYEGAGPDPERQDAPHAHSTLISPDGAHLLVADLGTDSLWVHRLEGGRPEPGATRIPMPAGFGPRHMLGRGDAVIVTGELSGEVASVSWTGGPITLSTAATLPSRSDGPAHQLSHLLALDDDHLLVGVRGADSFSVLRAGGTTYEIVQEMPTVDLPRHMAVAGDFVVTAGQRAGVIGVHPLWGTPRLGDGRVAAELEAVAYVLPG